MPINVDTVTIERDGGAAPFDYVLGSSEAFQPQTVTAVFDGTGAGGDFKPTLSVYAQNGALLGRWPANTAVAVGSSAEVTWAPRVKPAGAGSLVAWGRAVMSGAPQLVSADPINPVPVQVSFDPFNFGSDGSGVFFFDGAAPTFIQARQSPAPGVFIVTASFEHDDNAPTGLDPSLVRAVIEYSTPTNGSYLSQGVAAAFADLSGDPAQPGDRYGFGLSWQYPSVGDVTPVGFDLSVSNFNNLGADLNLAGAQMMVSLIAA